MEALILYFVLFFPRVYNSPLSGGISSTSSIPFSALGELGRTLTYSIPSLVLLWYIISDKKGFSAMEQVKPCKKDIVPFAAGLPGLIIIGLFISLVISLFSRYSGLMPPPIVEGPHSISGWIMMVFSCLATGYLEESYFRYYLLIRFENALPSPALRVILSTVLFSLCHIYEGPWGIINAVLAGVLLSLLFIRYRSLHGIALAHSAYNIFVYVMGNFGG